MPSAKLKSHISIWKEGDKLKTSGPVRRAQLIAPFGVGAMLVVRDGTALITAGLDHWFKQDNGTGCNDVDEFKVYEWRLQNLLKVDHFRMPPDYRDPYQGDEVPNQALTIPFLRFPIWHHCNYCGYMEEETLALRGKRFCPECEKAQRRRALVQVPFVAMCDHGHLQDFPWREWVHRSANPKCSGMLRLKATGGATLAGQRVECSCGALRSLAGIMNASPDGMKTDLSEKLDSTGAIFTCQGKRPWLGTVESEPCSRPLRGSLRSAANIYFAQVRSAIYLPRIEPGDLDRLVDMLQSLFDDPQLSSMINIMRESSKEISPEFVRALRGEQLKSFSNDEIQVALKVLFTPDSELADWSIMGDDDKESGFRRQEYDALKTERDTYDLKIIASNLAEYEPEIAQFFSRIMLVRKLRETRALSGFTRIFPDNNQGLEARKRFLWRSVPHGKGSWLPAYVVYGEGIFLELDEQRLRAWLSAHGDGIIKRVQPLLERYSYIHQSKRLHEHPLGARFVLLHTLSHLLINRLVFECGYSSASLRERLYVSDSATEPMAGLLIYTAAGDAEGTMGGLVRMGKPGYLEPVVRRALEGARWCSADPVCMELGNKGGQGPDSLNLAACHSCALVPETACEEFNRFLDRGLLIADGSDGVVGYFNSLEVK